MQKVITIYSQALLQSNWGSENAETVYPELQKLLDEGFKFKQVISENSTGNTTAVTLLLEK